MANVVKNLAALIKVKTIVTFCVLAVWMVLALTGVIDADAVNTVALMVIAFYFGTQAEKNAREV